MRALFDDLGELPDTVQTGRAAACSASVSHLSAISMKRDFMTAVLSKRTQIQLFGAA
jgi:hypothetical protein